MTSSLESRPRVLVGTLFCGESQIDACRKAVYNQKCVNIDQLIVQDLPSVEAHNTLWRFWNENRADYDMLVKVDADMVLMHDNILYNCYEFIQSNDGVNAVQLGLKDYFTDSTIYGLNCFSKNVWFNEAKDDYLCDRTYQGHERFVRGTDAMVIPLGLGAYHAPNPTPEQAFHFGMYRALKNQYRILSQVQSAYNREQDEGRKWVLIGAKCATADMRHHTSYLDEKFQKAFEEAKKKDWDL